MGNINNRLTVLRAEHGWSQKEVASHLNISRQTIISLEKNRYSPSLKLAFEIANLFQVNINDVFQYEREGRDE
ncbi:helix-turn-helix transcriptional regulator [Shouchella lonarensis]|uniref:Transcriptional regulator n=1 Tax=Shouchella lonarensis TaxID=1464122 RepID=A0A1G6MLU9_9BACI|nr:helix-turn-helix transcriptional regulator [Shouchella lonarensis]SDC56207.1 transcriptional regulator [Shouchella lonarensis]